MASRTRAISLGVVLGLMLPAAACADGLTRLADLSGAAGAAARRPAPWGQSLTGAYLAGRHAERQFDLGSAAGFIGKVLAADPEDRQLRQRLFLLLLTDGRIDESLPHAEALAAEGDGTPLAILRLAVARVRAGDYAAAEALLGRIDAKRGYAFLRHTGSAWLELGQGNVDAALAALEPLAQAPGLAQLRLLHRGLINEIAGRTEAAQAAYDELVGEDTRPSLRALQVAGSFFERHGQSDRAASLYESVRSASPTSASLLPAGMAPPVTSAADGFAEALLNFAEALRQERDAALGLVHMRLAEALRGDDPMTLLLIGEMLESEGRYDDARRHYARIPAASPFAKAAALRIARGLDDQKRTDDAIAALERLSQASGGDSDALVTLGHILRGHERFADAVVAYDKAIAMLGEPKPQHWSVLYARGIALERSGDWARAEADLRRALELSPDQPYVLNYLGYSWVDRGANLKEAEALIARAVELRPNDGFIADSLGWVYYVTGRYPEAVKELERAVALEPGDPTLNEHLGDAYWKSGRRNEARFQWAHAIKLGADAERAPEIQAKLDCGLGGCPAKTAGGS